MFGLTNFLELLYGFGPPTTRWAEQLFNVLSTMSNIDSQKR